jgi:hypothetical protein
MAQRAGQTSDGRDTTSVDSSGTVTLDPRIAWMDYSEAQRRQMRRAMDLLSEKGILDELGVGTIRDALSDALFPGTSTIQTRARYFLFVPWIYGEAERLKISSARIEAWRRQHEFDLTRALLRSGAVEGTFGRQAGDQLHRLASEVYWLGLGVLGIRRSGASQSHYEKSLDSLYVQRDGARRPLRDDDGQPLEDGPASNWHLNLPKAPKFFPEGCTFDLSRDEAEYLRDRIRASAPASFLNCLIGRDPDEPQGEFAWEHPAAVEAPARTRSVLKHAQTFSELMHGAALTYNLMLARALPDEALIASYEDGVAVWADVIERDPMRFTGWSLSDLILSLPPGRPIRDGTRFFVTEWHSIVRKALASQITVSSIPDDPRVQLLIRNREARLKGHEARLTNHRALERWSGAAGAGQLTFRWSNVTVLTRDINAGLALNA